MSEEFVGFDSATAGRIISATRKVEAHPLGRFEPRENSAVGALTPHTVVFRVTGATPTNGLYPCKWAQTQILASGITFDESAAIEGWGFGLNNAALQNGVYYFGQFRGYKPDDSRAVFVTNTVTGGGDLVLHEANPFTAQYTETFSTVAGLSFAEHQFEIDPDNITPNTYVPYLRSLNRYLPYGSSGGGGWQIMFAGTPADDPNFMAYWARYPTIFGLQLGVCAGITNGILVFGSALSSRVSAFVAHPTPSDNIVYILPKDPPKGFGKWNELSITGVPTAGFIRLGYLGQFSPQIQFNELGDLSTIQARLQSVTTVGVGNASLHAVGPCGGGAASEGGGRFEGPFANVMFFGALDNIEPQLISVQNQLSGATISATLKSSGSPWTDDQVLKAKRMPTGVYQLYWGDVTAGGGLDVHEILDDNNGNYTTYIESFLGKTAISFPNDYVELDTDPNSANGVVAAMRSTTPYAVFASLNPGANTTYAPKKPYSEFTDEPNTRRIIVGHENWADGEIVFMCAADASECVFRTTTDAGPVIYTLPNASEICAGKVLHTGAKTGGIADLYWLFAGVITLEGGVVKGGNSSKLDFNATDFTLSATISGPPPCDEETTAITTDGFTGTVGPFYKYTCVSGNLTQFTSAGFAVTRGLVKGQIASYV